MIINSGVEPTYNSIDAYFRSVTMRIFQLKPSQMVFVICSVLTILISGEFYLMRNIFSSTKIQAKDLNPDADLQYGPFDVMSPTLSTFNRELWLSGRIQVNVNQSFPGKFSFWYFVRPKITPVITSRMTFRISKRGYHESKFTRFITATYVRDNLNVIKHGWICSIQVSFFSALNCK